MAADRTQSVSVHQAAHPVAAHHHAPRNKRNAQPAAAAGAATGCEGSFQLHAGGARRRRYAAPLGQHLSLRCQVAWLATDVLEFAPNGAAVAAYWPADLGVVSPGNLQGLDLVSFRFG